MEKNTLRTSMKQQRKSEPQNLILEKSVKIKERLLAHPDYQKAKNILFYISYGNEVYTHDIIKHAFQTGKTINVPVTDVESRTLHISQLSSWDDLAPGAYGILEPVKEKQRPVHFDSIDLIIVPGVAFDRKGNRLGHGGGYYDWLIGKLPTVPTIGLAFTFQIVEELPVESSDQKVRTILTEDEIINCL